MARYKIYAGLGGGFGGANYVGTDEFESNDEAYAEAHRLALEEFEGHAGCHGLRDWTQCALDVLAQEGVIEDGDTDWDGELHQALIDEHGLEEDVNNEYTEEYEGWIDYHAVEVGDCDRKCSECYHTCENEGEDEDDEDYS